VEGSADLTEKIQTRISYLENGFFELFSRREALLKELARVEREIAMIEGAIVELRALVGSEVRSGRENQ
jgi:hypothetical protein